MTSGIGSYVTPDPVDTNPADPTVLETVIVASQSVVDIGGVMATVETFNGAIPGPTLRFNVGDTAIIRLVNNLDHPTSIHWHGIELANSADGTEVTQNAVTGLFAAAPPPPAPAGGTYLYKFILTRPGIYWYHPHHHLSTNRVFRGLYGMIVVTDPTEAALIAAGTIPAAVNTRQIVLSDVTVCKAAGANDTATYVNPNNVLPATDAAEWVSGATAQDAPTPVQLCQIGGGNSATNDDGTAAAVSYAAGDIPSMIRPVGRLNEGQTVLTNGMSVRARNGKPATPGGLTAGAQTMNVQPGQGLRLQFANAATIRYFRLVLTTQAGVQIPLVRIGGEGGLLDAAVVEGGTVGTFVTKYLSGEILLPPGSRADVVAAIPATVPVGSILTLWTRDYSRTGFGFSNLPTVSVMHLAVAGAVVAPTFAIPAGTPLRAAIPGATVETLPAANAVLLTPAGGFVAPKFGRANQTIVLNAGGTTSIDGVVGNFEGFSPYSSAPHLGSTRYAEAGRVLQLSVHNNTQAHHPFHLHGFSFQPISLTQGGSPTFTWPYREFRDNIDIPAGYTLTFRVRLDDRLLLDGITNGGGLGRWLFHCHIFFHHHHGMIGEVVVTGSDGSEKPHVDVFGSWAYAPSGGIAVRQGTFGSVDALAVTLTASLGSVVQNNANGTWSWSHSGPDATNYVYVTATDSEGRLDQTVFRVKIGAPDDGGDIGDPHIRTVDGKSYDFQAVGEFTLLRDAENGIEIQGRQTPIATAMPVTDGNTGLTACVSVNTAIAARIGAHRLSIQPGESGKGPLQLVIDGKPADLGRRGLDLGSGRVVMYPFAGQNAVRVDFADSTVLVVTPYFWNSYNVWILNVTVSRTDADMGLMGRIPPGTWLPLLPSGQSVGPKPADMAARFHTLYKVFADAWRVTDKTSLFEYDPGTSTKDFTDHDWPSDAPPCDTVKPQFEIPGARPKLENLDIKIAERICLPVVLPDLNLACVFDVATTGDEKLVEYYLHAQELRQRGTAVQLVSDKTLTRPGEPVTFTATAASLVGPSELKRGTIAFLVDDVPVQKPVEIDKQGRAFFKSTGLAKGARLVRAEFRAEGGRLQHDSSSPSLQHLVEERPPGDRNLAGYRLRGTFYESCDCFTICPCWLGALPDDGECTGVFAWQIEKGSIDGTEVSGLRVVSVSHHTGKREGAKQRVVIFVDEAADRLQFNVLAAAFSGKLGGPLQELSGLLGEMAGVERASIDLRQDGRLTTLTVGGFVQVEGMSREGPDGQPMSLGDGRLSTALGSPATVGESGRFVVDIRHADIQKDLRGRSTMSGRFSYSHAPNPGLRGMLAHRN